MLGIRSWAPASQQASSPGLEPRSPSATVGSPASGESSSSLPPRFLLEGNRAEEDRFRTRITISDQVFALRNIAAGNRQNGFYLRSRVAATDEVV